MEHLKCLFLSSKWGLCPGFSYVSEYFWELQHDISVSVRNNDGLKAVKWRFFNEVKLFSWIKCQVKWLLANLKLMKLFPIITYALMK